MKIIKLTVIIQIFCKALIFCGELIIDSPVTTGSLVYQIKYKPDERFKEFDSLHLICYQFEPEKSFPVAKVIKLNFNMKNHVWSNKFVSDSNTIFILFKVLSSGPHLIIDDNYGDYWDLFIKKNGEIADGANLLAATSYLGILPENCRRNVDFHKALNYLERELTKDSLNIQAGIGLNSLMYDLKKITEGQFINNITKILSRFDEKQMSYRTDDEIRSLIRGYNIINNREYAEKIEKKWAELNPKSEIAETNLLNKIKSSASLNEFLKYTSNFLKLFPDSHSKDKIYFAIIEAFMQSGKYRELLNHLDTIKIYEPTIYLEIAANIQNNKYLSKKLKEEEKIYESKKIIEKYLDPIFKNNNFENNFISKPRFFSKLEWSYKRLLLKAKISEGCGDFYYGINNILKAGNYYQIAYNILKDNTESDLYYKLIDVSIKSENILRALNHCENAILNSEDSPEILNKHKELYIKLNQDSLLINLYPRYVDSLKLIAKLKRFEKLKYSILSNKTISGTYRTLDGRVFDFNDLKGKLAVILFWSSWCEPCKAIYTAYKEIFNKYKNSDSAILISMNVWEKSDKRLETIEQFLKLNDLGFPVFIDDYGLIPYNAGITGLPAMIFIDKHLNIRFIELGFENESQLQRDVEDRLNFLFYNKE